MKNPAAACLALALLLAAGCATTDSYWSFPVIGSACKNKDVNPADAMAVAALLVLCVANPTGAGALLEAAPTLLIFAGVATVGVATDLAILPITLVHDTWLYIVRKRRQDSKRSGEFKRVLFDDDPEAWERFRNSKAAKPGR